MPAPDHPLTFRIHIQNQLRLKEAARSSKWLKMLDHWKEQVGTEKLRKRVYKGE
jgi:hypothetical protein